MGTWDRPIILPRQPGFLEKIAPALLQTAAQFGMQKLGQDWQASQKKIDKEHENRKLMIKGLMDNTLRVAQAKQTAPPTLGQRGQAATPQQQAERPSGFTVGNQVLEPVPMADRFQVVEKDGVRVLVSGDKATQITEKEPKKPASIVQEWETYKGLNPNKTMDDFYKSRKGGKGALSLEERKELELYKAGLKPSKAAKILSKDDINKRLLSLEQAKLKIQTTKGLDPLTMFLIKDNPEAQAAYQAGDTSTAIAEIDGQIAYYNDLRDSRGLTLPKGLTEEDIKFNMTKYGKSRAEVIAAFKKQKK